MELTRYNPSIPTYLRYKNIKRPIPFFSICHFVRGNAPSQLFCWDKRTYNRWKTKKYTQNNMKKLLLQAKGCLLQPLLALLDYSLPRSLHLVSCPRTLLGYELSVAGMAWAKTQASQEAPSVPPMRQTLVITFPRRVSQRQLCKPLVITAVGQW